PRRPSVADRHRRHTQPNTRSRRLRRDDRVAPAAVLIRHAVTVDALLAIAVVHDLAALDVRLAHCAAAIADGALRRDRAAGDRARERQRVASAAAAELAADRAADQTAGERRPRDPRAIAL